MELSIYSIFDQAAKAFTQPFFMQNDGLAIRAFQGNVNSKEPNNISDYPDQFTLYHIGTYNDQTGAIDSIEPKTLGNGTQYKEDTNNIEQYSEQLTKIEDLLQQVLTSEDISHLKSVGGTA